MITKVIKIIILVMSLVLVTGCSRVSDEDIIAGRKAAKIGAMIIDVRSEKEFNKEGHIKGAVNIPIAYVDRMFNSLPKDKEIVVYCRTGARSEIAARLLREQGWTVHDVQTQEDWERKITPKPLNKEN